MNALRRFGLFWLDFVVGDDWTVAVAVIVGVGVTAVVAHDAHTAAWWLLPVIVAAIVGLSLARAVSVAGRAARAGDPDPGSADPAG